MYYTEAIVWYYDFFKLVNFGHWEHAWKKIFEFVDISFKKKYVKCTMQNAKNHDI